MDESAQAINSAALTIIRASIFLCFRLMAPSPFRPARPPGRFR